MDLTVNQRLERFDSSGRSQCQLPRSVMVKQQILNLSILVRFQAGLPKDRVLVESDAR
jgi:hypothetical protein